MSDLRVYVRYGPSRSLRGERRVPTWYAGGVDTLCLLGLDAAALEFIIEKLPYDDYFTKGLRDHRDQAKEELWLREAL